MFCEVNSKCGGDGDGLVVVVTMTVTVTVVVTVTVTLTVVVAGFYKDMLLVDQAAAVVVVKNNFECTTTLAKSFDRASEENIFKRSLTLVNLMMLVDYCDQGSNSKLFLL